MTSDGIVAGTRPTQLRAIDESPAPVPHHDPPLQGPARPCACCGNPFQPTLRRRCLCARCFASDGDPYAGQREDKRMRRAAAAVGSR